MNLSCSLRWPLRRRTAASEALRARCPNISGSGVFSSSCQYSGALPALPEPPELLGAAVAAGGAAARCCLLLSALLLLLLLLLGGVACGGRRLCCLPARACLPCRQQV